MPKDYDNGKIPYHTPTPRHLSVDSIQDDHDVNSQLQKNTFLAKRKPEVVFPVSDSEIRYLESTRVSAEDEIKIPNGLPEGPPPSTMNGYTRESGAKRKNAIIAGITNPTNRLHTPHTPNQYGNNSRASSSNSSKRRFEHIQFEKPRSKTKKPKVEDQVLSIFDEAKSDEVKSVSGMGRGFKSQTGSSKEASVNISSEEESPDHKDSLQSKSKIPVEIPGRKGSSGKTKWVLRTSQLEPKKKVRALISAPSNKKQKREKWELSAFHRGTRHIKEPDLHLEVSSTIKEFQLKLFQGENELDVGPISDNKVSKVLYFPDAHWFGLELKSVQLLSEKKVSFSVRGEDVDTGPLMDIFKRFPALKAEKVEEKRMNKFITDLSESLTREQENGASLVEDSAEINGPQQNLLERGASIARQLHQQEMAPQRRSTRSAPEPPAELQPAKRAKRDKAQKPEYVKRTHSKSEEDYPKTRSKSPEIKLPPQWPGPLLYPFEGPKRTNVDHEDLNRLKNSEFLNDNIINFYLRYLEEGLREKSPSMAQEFHFFNTFFYERLSMKTADKKRNMDGVLKWTAKIDLFKKNYVIVPINESSHWYLAIICNLQHLDRKLKKPEIDTAMMDSDGTMDADPPPPPQDQSLAVDEPEKMDIVNDSEEVADAQTGLENMSVETTEEEWPEENGVEIPDDKIEQRNKVANIRIRDIPGQKSEQSAPSKNVMGKTPKKHSHYKPPDSPAIIILDSMSGSGPRKSAVGKLKDWLVLEAKTKRGFDVKPGDFKGNFPKTVNQENYYDCGLYVLHYVREFINSPEDFTKSFLERDVKNIDFLDPGKEKITGMRLELRDLIVDLHTKYEAQQLCFGQETKKIRDEDSSAAASAEDDDDPVEHNLTSADKPGDQSAEADIRGEVVKDGEPLAEEQESAIKDGDSSGEGERSGEPSDEGKSAIKDGDPVDEDNAQDTVVLGGDDNKPGLGDYWETPNQPSQVL